MSLKLCVTCDKDYDAKLLHYGVCEKGSFFFIIREGHKSYLVHPVQKMYSAVKFIKSDQPVLKFLIG